MKKISGNSFKKMTVNFGEQKLTYITFLKGNAYVIFAGLLREIILTAVIDQIIFSAQIISVLDLSIC